MRLNKLLLLFLTTLLLMTTSACMEEEEEDNDEAEDEVEELEELVEEIELTTLDILIQADLLPLADAPPVLAQENDEEEEDENDEEEDENDDEEGEDDEVEENGDDEMEEELQEDITFEKTILNEILNKELEDHEEDDEELLIESSEEIWDDIKDSVTELYESWNELESMLDEKGVPSEVIDPFEQELDTLTVSSSDHDHWKTLISANNLTLHLYNFKSFFSDEVTAQVFEIKYHVRNTVLMTAEENTEEAQNSIDKINELSKEIEIEFSEDENEKLYERFMTSLDDLEEEQNLDLIKLKASSTMENTVELISSIEE
ncbi:hypothetical protein [Natranaerobius trueperi]|uniref:Uncharacterized protein n=1 Tax=Natranaerobius trueperi TaxID=759412 RepID=A0A226BXA2_9FIRM|nr:hypothetical protein [Natranaerobius trueperi]OWZ82829.1 hypothetical protein CDO51_12005 [Natranaerobius trueperi]